MRALVTGGSGFLGGHLVSALYHRGYSVTVVDNEPPNYIGVYGYIKFDIAERFIHRDPKEWDVVFHCVSAFVSHLIAPPS